MDLDADVGDNSPYLRYRHVRQVLLRANLEFAEAVGAQADAVKLCRLARRVSRLQLQEDDALVAMRRHDRAWMGRPFRPPYRHSDGAVG
ncbi:MAG: hypothetical protein NVS2B4_08650 [Ramlibacter sp.]